MPEFVGVKNAIPVACWSELGRNFFEATVELMCILARACGHGKIADFRLDDLATWKREMAHLTGVRYAGVMQP